MACGDAGQEARAFAFSFCKILFCSPPPDDALTSIVPLMSSSHLPLTPQRRPQPETGGRTRFGAILYGVFWLLLVLPRFSGWRRRPAWPRVRLAVGLTGTVLAAAGASSSSGFWVSAGAFLILFAVLARPLSDPEALQKLAESVGATYVLDAGESFLFLGKADVSVVKKRDLSRIEARIALSDVRDVEIDGEPYRASYVSFAKAPPHRDEKSLKGSEARLEILVLEGPPLRFLYRGAFSRHLAEVAAHTIVSVKNLKPDEVLEAVRGLHVPR